MNWDWEFTLNEVLPRLLKVVPITIEATLLGFTIAASLGLLLAVGRMSKNPWISRPLTEIIEFIRGTPILVQIFFMFFLLPEVGIVLPAFTTGVIALGLHYSTYCSEVYRSGLQSVPKGQWEAAIALNLSPYRTFTGIIIPQAIPPVVPALGNYLIGMFKETPLLSFIAVVELMMEAKLIGSEWFQYREPVTMVGVFFLALSLIAAFGVRRVEHWLNTRRA
ncbi:MAG: ectoine/hydroxyectoine ABC transporter permease subunit EhuD [Gammaproteobacteria bacterium]|nr:ectoine/hydroxyectoine ABC transporter permease subunit EhuD [Gammaproteobacteria bacterium]